MDPDPLTARLLAMPPARLAALAGQLTEPELRALDAALDRAWDEAWRRTPATFSSHLDDTFIEYRHVPVLADAFARAVNGESTRQLWMQPPGYGKSLNLMRGVLWALDRDPTYRVIWASYGDTLAQHHNAQMRDDALRWAPQLRFTVASGSQSRALWGTTGGGYVLASGIGGGITGFRAQLAIVDDPFKGWEDAHSAAERDRVWDWYRSVLTTRLLDERSAVIVCGTRWHEDDLHGRLLASPDAEHRWEVLRLPALAEHPDQRGGAWWQQLPDPLGRAPGEVIDARRYSPAAVAARHTELGSYFTAAMDQQNPASPGGGIFKRAWWRYYTTRPQPWEGDWLTSWDASFAAKEGGSYVVGQVWCRTHAGALLVDEVRDRMLYPEFRAAVAALAAKYPHVTLHLIEDKANGPAVIADLGRTLDGLVPRTPRGSKESRARAVSATVEAGRVLLPDPTVDDPEGSRAWVHDYVQELADFPTGSNDDRVDTTTQALLEFAQLPHLAGDGLGAVVRTTAPGRR